VLKRGWKHGGEGSSANGRGLTALSGKNDSKHGIKKESKKRGLSDWPVAEKDGVLSEEKMQQTTALNFQTYRDKMGDRLDRKGAVWTKKRAGQTRKLHSGRRGCDLANAKGRRTSRGPAYKKWIK